MASKPKPNLRVVKVQTGDPLDINARLYKQLARLLDDMEAADRDERMTMPQRIQALIAVGRVQTIFANLRKAQANDPADAGSAVRKYASAFSRPDAVGGRGASARPAFEPFDDGDGGDDDGGEAA